jgi:hypothetical protein
MYLAGLMFCIRLLNTENITGGTGLDPFIAWNKNPIADTSSGCLSY